MMADGRQKDAWWRTSELMALIANTSRDTKRKRSPYTGADFNPLTRKVRKAKPGTMRELAALLKQHGR